MIVTNPDGSIVDPYEVDCSFFVCTVDLWDHHGTTEMNLVLHPSSSDKVPVPTPAPATPAPPPPSGPSWQQSGAGPSSANDATPYRPWSVEPGGSTSPTFIPAPEQDKTDRQIQSLPRHTYTRTLVGPLSANAQLLKDEHRKPGIFFLFQDLSVRTEGSFRLRMRLVNIGAHPAPDPGAVGVHTDVSPVLAQTFTEPFTVWSAKRFPGVPDTTALSIAFGNQGQKLPLVRPIHYSQPPCSHSRSGIDTARANVHALGTPTPNLIVSQASYLPSLSSKWTIYCYSCPSNYRINTLCTSFVVLSILGRVTSSSKRRLVRLDRRYSCRAPTSTSRS